MTNERGSAEQLAQRAIDTVLTLVRRATALAGAVLAAAVLCAGGGFVLGLAALSGGIRTVWFVVGGFFAFVAIGAVASAMVRLWLVKRSAGALVTEFRTMIGADPRAERTVIETVESADGVQQSSAVVMSRQFFSLHGEVRGRVGQFTSLGAALSAITSFPLLVLLSVALSIGFAFLSLLFLIALAL